MFQDFGSCEVAVLGDMSDKDNGYMVLLGVLHEFSRYVPNLGHGSRGRVQFLLIECLDRIYQNQLGLGFFNGTKNGGRFGFA